MKRLVCMLVWSGLIALEAGAQEPNCPEYTTAEAAETWFKTGRAFRPVSTARCLAERASQLPVTGDNITGWRRYLWITGSFLQSMYDQSHAGSPAQKLYKSAELVTWNRSRELIAKQLESMPLGPARTDVINEYKQVINHLSNAYWRKAALDGANVQTLQPFHELMTDLNPVYLLSQTAVRWVEAIRSCPAWVPDAVQKVPTYGAFCAAGCQFDNEEAAKKLRTWAAGVSDSPRKVLYVLRVRDAEITEHCKEQR